MMILLVILGLTLFILPRIETSQTKIGNFEENDVFRISHTVPESAKVGEEFAVSIKVEVKKSVKLMQIKEALGGLNAFDLGDFLALDQGFLKGVALEVRPAEVLTFSYIATCPYPSIYTITGFAETKLNGRAQQVWESAKVNCTE